MDRAGKVSSCEVVATTELTDSLSGKCVETCSTLCSEIMICTSCLIPLVSPDMPVFLSSDKGRMKSILKLESLFSILRSS